MNPIIQVSNLSKRYIIGHQHLKGKRTFREAIVQSVNSMGSRFKHSFSGNINPGSSLEEFWALRDINFEVEEGDRIGIIGRNGAGKSTLLKVLSRITEPTTGRIVLNGRVASLLEVGTGFNGELTGRENIFLNGAILGMKREEIRRKFDEIVDFSGVEKFLDTPVKRYSSGMYVRLAFAVAAHLEPEILVVDEVLAVGDAEFQEKCLGKMQDVSKHGGRTVVFVSHNLAAVKSLCEKVILLEKGRIVTFDNTIDVIDLYRTKSKTSKNSNASFEKVDLPAFFTSIKLFNKDELTNHFSWEDEITIQLEFEIKEILMGTYIAMDICNSDDSIVLWLSDIETKEFLKRIPGKYILKFVIPPKTLANGSYYLNFGILRPHTIAIQAHYRAIDFKIEDLIEFIATKSIKYPGLIKLPIEAKYY